MAPISLRAKPKSSRYLGASPSPLWSLLHHLAPHSVCSSPTHMFYSPRSVDWLLPMLRTLLPIYLLVKLPHHLQICSHLTFSMTPILTTPLKLQPASMNPRDFQEPPHRLLFHFIFPWHMSLSSTLYNLLIYYSYCLSLSPNPPPRM